MTKDLNLILSNKNIGLSRYAANFDYRMHDYVIETLSEFFVGGEAAELGSYKGEMTKKLAKCFDTVAALEIEDELCHFLSENTPDNVNTIKCDFTQYTDFDSYSDLFSVHSLEHINDHLGFLKHLKMHKNEEAHLYVVVPNGLSLSRQIAVEMGLMKSPTDITKFEKSIGHFHTFTTETLKKDIEEAGFQIVANGGIMPKIFSNGQYDSAFEKEIIDTNYLDACYKLSSKYPEICASIFFVCK